MTKTELESKHLAELHALAAEAGVDRYRMLSRAELIERLAGSGASKAKPKGSGREGSSRRRRGREGGPREQRDGGSRERREGGSREQRDSGSREQRDTGSRESGERRRREPEAQRKAKAQSKSKAQPKPEPTVAPATTPGATTPPPTPRPKRKRRRRWGRRGRKTVRVQDLLLPTAPGRQAIVYAESRADCTALLREVAAELSGGADGADPIALLVDPSPEELADWRRDAPKAEIVAAGKANHADDAIAQAARRAAGGEEVVVLIDSLSRFAESFGGADDAKRLFDAGREASGGGTLTVVAAVERSA